MAVTPSKDHKRREREMKKDEKRRAREAAILEKARAAVESAAKPEPEGS